MPLRAGDLLLLHVYMELAFTQPAMGLGQGRDEVYALLGTRCPIVSGAIGAIPYAGSNLHAVVLLHPANHGVELLAVILIAGSYAHVEQHFA